MNHESGTIRSFTDLDAWKEGHKLVLMIYKVTKDFPKEEMFGLVSQVRRCAVSITSNIAEGFSRWSYKEKAQFYSIALGSVTELQSQLLIARDVGYVSNEKFNEIAERTIKVHKIINGLIKSSKAIIHRSHP
ncbi:MAG: four helix bundle protein [Patescibacteria group bacterium]